MTDNPCEDCEGCRDCFDFVEVTIVREDAFILREYAEDLGEPGYILINGYEIAAIHRLSKAILAEFERMGRKSKV
jgi:hypothetical protein